MKRLSFTYTVNINFDSLITDHQFQLRCIPEDNIHQKVESISYHISPSDHLSLLKDGFNNTVCVGSCLTPHNNFSFFIKGIIQVDNHCYEKSMNPIFKYPTELTYPSAKIISLAKQVDKSDPLTSSLHLVYNYMEYKPNTTTIYTSASQAMKQGCGVCQDYSHILISILRYCNIPARYIVGMMVGDGASHAWVEAYFQDGWIGIDPTNNKYVDDNYIQLSNGRDYNDCVIDKGTFFGKCNQEMKLKVKVDELI